MAILIFDLDDTLFDLAKPLFEAMSIVYSNRIPPLSNEHFTAFRKYSDERFEESQSGAISMEEMYIYRIRKTLWDMGVSTTDSEALLFQDEYLRCQQNIHLSPVVREMLCYCRENNIITAIISNGSAEHQMKKVNTLGLTDFIPKEHIFLSGSVGYAKPDPRIFTYAAEKLCHHREKTYYIGDSFLNDIIGPKKIFFGTVWYNRRNYLIESDVTPDYTVTTDSELYEIVKLIANE
ncbi:MAG: HAD family hydrolase [Lachnospiraceae bacterium]|nr:HAD family hydrolase [Lachnospiraceae bacterium]